MNRYFREDHRIASGIFVHDPITFARKRHHAWLRVAAWSVVAAAALYYVCFLVIVP
jgi:hypothetical protein